MKHLVILYYSTKAELIVEAKDRKTAVEAAESVPWNKVRERLTEPELVDVLYDGPLSGDMEKLAIADNVA